MVHNGPARQSHQANNLTMKPLPNLSKSKFVAGWQCLTRLYLQVYQRELAAEIDEATQAILTQGQEVGQLAQKAFPDGVLVEAGHLEIEMALAETRRLMADSSIPAIFEAAFLYDNVLVRVDILERRPRNRWRLIEVKSATGVKNITSTTLPFKGMYWVAAVLRLTLPV